jgi:hypothetical protein
VIPIVLIVFGVIAAFTAAIAVPPRTCLHIARSIAGIALAVEVVAYVLLLVAAGAEFSWPVFLWIAVGWLVFPITFTGLGLALTLREPPHVLAVWGVCILLFSMSAVLIWNVGMLIAPSALLMLLSAVFLLGSQYDGRMSTSQANG